jgi:hypothetical protein
MTEAEKMAERLEERGKRTPRTWATSDLYYEAAALIRRLQAENDTKDALRMQGEAQVASLLVEIASLRAENERQRARETQLVEALVSIEEYWNREPTDGAMLDALDVMTARARAAIEEVNRE